MTDIRHEGPERVTAFSDGVFAIAITLLVLPLTDAEIDPERVGESLQDLLPSILTFALSFAVIGRYWVVHHRLFEQIVRVDGGLLTLNLVYLFAIAFLPFPTSVLADNGSTAGTLLYALNLLAVGTISMVLWWYASTRGRLVRPEVTARDARVRLIHAAAPTVALLPSIPLAFVAPDAAKWSWLLIVPVSVLGDRMYPDDPR